MTQTVSILPISDLHVGRPGFTPAVALGHEWIPSMAGFSSVVVDMSSDWRLAPVREANLGSCDPVLRRDSQLDRNACLGIVLLASSIHLNNITNNKAELVGAVALLASRNER
jgi:hypothetical protein